MKETTAKSAPKVDTLDHLRSGCSCEVLSIANQSPSVKRRLIDMGLTPGQLPTYWFEPVRALNRVVLPQLGLPARAIFHWRLSWAAAS